MSKRKVIIVLGPTASGKSSVALKLAKEFNGFLISADSRQVYKQMDIGTNKDHGYWDDGKFYLVSEGQVAKSNGQGRGKEQGLRNKNSHIRGIRIKANSHQSIQEYMVDIIDPDQEFSLDDWLKQVKEIIKYNPDRQPIIVGGTGLYISALVNDYQFQAGLDETLRAKLEKLVEKKGVPALIKKIKKIDPDIESKIDITNPRRVIRTAEILLQTKKPLQKETGESEFEFLQIGISLPREKLYDKIDTRVDQMIELGLIEEVKTLIAKGYDCSSKAMSGIGYRQVCQFLNNEISGEESVRLIKRDTRRYAKRQLTWFKRDKTIRWVKDFAEGQSAVSNFLK